MATTTFNSGRLSSICMRAAVGAAVLALIASSAAAQQRPANPAPPPAQQQQSGWFGSISAWFDRQVAGAQSAWQGMGREVQEFGREADSMARTSVDKAKEAANAVGKLRNTTVVAGNEKCALAPNGAPDCVSAALKMCKASGYSSGQSLSMTTAEECPANVYISGRGAGVECPSYTFVSRALCQ